MTVQALLNFNDTSGTQVFTDDTGNQTWTVKNGAPILSDVESVHGGVSLLFPDLDDGSIQSTLATTITGDFTFEVWLHLIVGISWGQQIVYFADIDVTVIIDGTSQIQVFYTTANVIQAFNIGFSIPLNEWFHFALVRKGDRLYCLVNGKLSENIGEGWNEPLSVIELGQYYSTGTSRYFDGYMDGVRISDEAIYLTNNVEYLTQGEPGLTYNIMSPGHAFFDHVLDFITDHVYLKSYNGLGGGDIDLVDQIEFVCTGDEGEVIVPDPDPTTTNIISGNVTKLGLPYELKIVAVTVELNPEVVGQTISDSVTGDYSIDVWPWTGDTLVYAAPDYGLQFNTSSFVASGQVIHPTTPNKNVYIAQNDGILGGSEPVWVDSGFITSNEVQLLAAPLYRPLINGFIKPTVTPI